MNTPNKRIKTARNPDKQPNLSVSAIRKPFRNFPYNHYNRPLFCRSLHSLSYIFILSKQIPQSHILASKQKYATLQPLLIQDSQIRPS